jgi:pimeloyl-ACP methyl ester carboxylesterase
MIDKRITITLLFILVITTSSYAIQNTVFSDVDNDGDLDFYLEVLIRTASQNRFFYLNGTDGIGNIANVKQGYFVDVNGDNREDLYIVRNGSPNYLYLRTGSARFTNATSNWLGRNLTGSTISPLAASFDDLNNNGIVDAFVNGNLFLDITSPLTFINATNISNINELPRLKQVKIKDLNLDNNKDIIGVTENGSLVVFLSFGDSNGDGSPEFFDATLDLNLNNITSVNFVEAADIKVGLAVNRTLNFFPYTNIAPPFISDNFTDLYLARNGSNNLFIQMFPNTRQDYKTANEAMFHLPIFLDESTGVNDSSNSTGVIIADFDNNNMLDLFIANGNPLSQLFLRNGSSWNNQFVNQGLNFSGINISKLAQAADVNNDGLLDIAYIDASGIYIGQTLISGTTVFDISGRVANDTNDTDVQENQVLTDAIINMADMAKTPSTSSPDMISGEVEISEGGHLFIGGGNIIFRDMHPREPPAPRPRGGGGGGGNIIIPDIIIPPEEPEKPPVALPEKPPIEPPVIKPPVTQPIVSPTEILENPVCGNFTGIYIPGLGIVTKTTAFDIISKGVKIVKDGVLIQNKHIRYAGPYVDFTDLDFKFGEQVIFCKEPASIIDQFKPYFFLWDPDFFVPLLTTPTKIKKGEDTEPTIKAKCGCPDGKLSSLGTWVRPNIIATSKGIYSFENTQPFEENKILDVCLPASAIVGDVLLSLTDLFTDKLSQKNRVAVPCGDIVSGVCTPYKDCSITAPTYYKGEHVDIILPSDYVFATSIFKVPTCNNAVDANIVVPGGYSDLKIYRVTDKGYEEVQFTITDGLSCNDQPWKDVVAETKTIVEPKESKLIKVYDGGSNQAILLLHGLFSSSATFDQLIEELEYTHQPYQVYIYDYSSSEETTFDETVNILAKELKALDVGSLSIFAHSLGGLISEKAVMKLYDENPEALSKIKRIIVAGTPHKGSKGLKNLAIVSDIVGSTPLSSFPASKDLISAALRGKETERVPGIEYIVFAGDKTTFLTSALMSKPNDGLVTTASAKTIGDEKIDNYYEFDISHMNLPDSTISLSELFKIVGEDISSETALKGYSTYLHIENVPVENTEFIIAGRRPASKPISACFISQLILYLAGIILILSLFLHFKSKLYYFSIASVIGLAIVSTIICKQFPYVFAAVILASYLTKLLFPKSNLPISTEFEISMALAYNNVLNNTYTDSTFKEQRDIFNKLNFHDKTVKYDDLRQLSSSVENMDKQAIVNNIEKHVENSIRKTARKKILRIVKGKLRKLKKLSPKLEFLLK